jgi:hypothetical protein
MIEIKKAGEVCTLMLRRDRPGPERQRAWLQETIYQQAQPEDLVNALTAGDPKIVGRMREVGWFNKPGWFKELEASTSAAELLYAATDAYRLLERLNNSDTLQPSGELKHIGKSLQTAINNYTDNVSPPEDAEPSALFSRDVLPDEIDEDPLSTIDEMLLATLRGEFYRAPAEPKALLSRDVLPDEIDEDPGSASRIGGMGVMRDEAVASLLVIYANDLKSEGRSLAPVVMLEAARRLSSETEGSATAAAPKVSNLFSGGGLSTEAFKVSVEDLARGTAAVKASGLGLPALDWPEEKIDRFAARAAAGARDWLFGKLIRIGW